MIKTKNGLIGYKVIWRETGLVCALEALSLSRVIVMETSELRH